MLYSIDMNTLAGSKAAKVKFLALYVIYDGVARKASYQQHRD